MPLEQPRLSTYQYANPLSLMGERSSGQPILRPRLVREKWPEKDSLPRRRRISWQSWKCHGESAMMPWYSP